MLERLTSRKKHAILLGDKREIALKRKNWHAHKAQESFRREILSWQRKR